jgi:hypothetical protein
MGLINKSNSKSLEAQIYGQQKEHDAPPPAYSLEGESSNASSMPHTAHLPAFYLEYGGQLGEAFRPPAYPPPRGSHVEPLYVEASLEDFNLGEQFCQNYPLYASEPPQPDRLQQSNSGLINLVTPPSLGMRHIQRSRRFKGHLQNGKGDGTTYVRSEPDSPDTVLISDVPLHFALAGEEIKRETVYYEITIVSLGNPNDSTVALGFACLPYPPFRLPGWHRGSIAIHSDDGRLYVNDSLNGKDFSSPLTRGETIGLGIDFGRQTVFLTRNGKLDGEFILLNSEPGIDETRNFQDGKVQGVDGTLDVFAAVGVCGTAGIIVNFGARLPFKYNLAK